MVVKYEIVMGSADEVEGKVNAMFRQGWRLHGSTSVQVAGIAPPTLAGANVPRILALVAQAMVLEQQDAA
jgi:hypothetical protein